jgi:hypothetical protein
MTTPQPPVTSKTARVIHGALVAGVLLFAIVGHFALKQASADSAGLASNNRVLLGVSLGACVLSLLLRGRVPKRSANESADFFWSVAGPYAMQVWAPLEAAGLLSVLVYTWTRSVSAVAVAAVALLLFVVLNPGYFERR